MANFIYSGDVEKLNGRAPFSDGECVALVQATTSVGHTSRWRPGPRVVDLSYMNPGTVIANFVFDKQGNGRFPNQHGYHAALFVEFCGRGVSSAKKRSIRVMDQWRTRIPIPSGGGKSSRGAKVRPREAPIPTQISQTSSTS